MASARAGRVRAMNELRPLAFADARAAAAVLGRAFVDSPGYAAIFAHFSAERRLAAVTHMKRGFVEAAIRHHEATGVFVDGVLAGVSLVQPPGTYPTSLRAKAWQARGAPFAGVRGVVRLLRVEAYTDSVHLRAPHYYLFVLGVDTAFQGKGLGKQLLAVLAAKADARGVLAYLETDKEINVKLYRSAGYEVVTDEKVRGVGFRMWTMKRDRGASA